MTKRLSHIFLLIVILFASCLNKYEKEIIGVYQVTEFKLADTVRILPEALPTLTIRSNKTFRLNFSNREISGKWEADDYGDWTLANFQYKNIDAQGQIGNDQISIINPWQFESPYLTKMVFTRQTK